VARTRTITRYDDCGWVEVPRPSPDGAAHEGRTRSKYSSRSSPKGGLAGEPAFPGGPGRLAQLGERLPYKQEVGGSIPSPPTKGKARRYGPFSRLSPLGGALRRPRW
jgi:hypothetical protein